jgi:Uma2 family endonuclease
MTITLAKWSIEDYHRILNAGVFDNQSVELLKGEIINMPPEGESHAYFSSTAAEYLMQLLSDRALIRSAKPITLPNDSEPEPDIAIVKRLGREYLEHHPYPQNIFWLIEYSDSTLEKDLDLKTKVYAEVGIPEYWVVNLRKRQVVVFRDPEDSDYLSKFTISEGTINPLTFPEVCVSVESIVSR